MSGEDLAKAVESIVLKVIASNPDVVVNAVKLGVDSEADSGVELVNTIQQKLLMPSTPLAPLSSADQQLESDGRVSQLIKDLDKCLSGTRSKFIEEITGMGLATEDYVDDAVSEKLDDFCTEDTVRDMINGAWSGA